MFVNIIQTYRDVVAICDKELIGKKFEEDDFQLDVKENFFKGEEKSSEEVSKIIQDFSKEDATFNIVGEKAVALAIKNNLVAENAVKKISGIPFTLKLI